MKNTLVFLLTILTLLSCGGNRGQFRLKGRFTHLEQGEFLLYSMDGGLSTVDSLHVVDGQFDYTVSLEDEATYRILYPNFSELVIFGHSGGVVKVEGDAQNLNAVQVKGDEDNETYTKFRQEIDQKPDTAVISIARQYIFQHPGLSMSRYLFRRYFLQNDAATRAQATEVFDSLRRALPDDVRLSRFADAIRSKGVLTVGQTMPKFELRLRKTPASLASYSTVHDTIFSFPAKGEQKALLMVFWATWKTGSQSGLYRARRIQRESEGKVASISYSLDVDESELRHVEELDSITYPCYCDYKCWNSTYVRQWGICDLPYFILIGANHRILAMGPDYMKDIDPKAKKFCKNPSSDKGELPERHPATNDNIFGEDE